MGGQEPDRCRKAPELPDALDVAKERIPQTP